MHVDDCDPMIASPIPSRFHTRNIRQLDEPIRCNSGTEAPPFRAARFEISELFATDSVDKKIAGLAIQGFRGTRKSATELLQLRDVHERTT